MEGAALLVPPRDGEGAATDIVRRGGGGSAVRAFAPGLLRRNRPRRILLAHPHLKRLQPFHQRIEHLAIALHRRRPPRLGDPRQLPLMLAQQLQRVLRRHRQRLGRRRPISLHPPRPLGRQRRLRPAQGQLLEPRITKPKRLPAPRRERGILAPVPEHRPVMKPDLARRQRAIADRREPFEELVLRPGAEQLAPRGGDLEPAVLVGDDAGTRTSAHPRLAP